MNFVANSVIWRDRGLSNTSNKGISANYKRSILVQWHETPHSELGATSLFSYLISGSKFLWGNLRQVSKFHVSDFLQINFTMQGN